jgi:A/G-specific adenine glycosylase
VIVLPNQEATGAFSRNLLAWWKKNKRKFPWRETRDPYKILMSEILLHRTKAQQVVPIYNKFVEKYPTIESARKVTLEEMREMLFPLGLHWRADALYKMIMVVIEKYCGRIPSTKQELESLPGVSDYISAAVLCFAFDTPQILLDTNIVRILGRFYGEKQTDNSRRSKIFQQLAFNSLDKLNPRYFNYALIDLGALICKPKKPDHNSCPLKDLCHFVKCK